jgi:hypothetical protein
MRTSTQRRQIAPPSIGSLRRQRRPAPYTPELDLQTSDEHSRRSGSVRQGMRGGCVVVESSAPEVATAATGHRRIPNACSATADFSGRLLGRLRSFEISPTGPLLLVLADKPAHLARRQFGVRIHGQSPRPKRRSAESGPRGTKADIST